MAARKSGEALVYKRTLVPTISEKDPSDNPSFGDMWIDISVNPPVVKILDSLLTPIVVVGGALAPPVTITGTNPATVPFTIVGAAAQASHLVDITNSVPTNMLFLTKDGNLVLNPQANLSAGEGGPAHILLNMFGTTSAGLVIKAAAGTTNGSDFLAFEDAGGGVLTFVQGDGSVSIGVRAAQTTTTALGVFHSAPTTTTPTLIVGLSQSNPVLQAFASTTQRQVQIRRNDTQAVDIFDITNAAGGTVLVGVGSNGQVSIAATSTVTPFTITPNTGTSTVFQIAAPTGFGGLFVDWAVNAVSMFKVDLHGNTTFGDGTVAPTVGANQIGFGSTTATSATAGVNGAVPAQVAGYWIVNIAGTQRKIPFYAT